MGYTQVLDHFFNAAPHPRVGPESIFPPTIHSAAVLGTGSLLSCEHHLNHSERTMPMKRTCNLLALLMLISLPTAAVADGLLYQLPNDGSWVRYDMTLEMSRGGQVQKMTGEVTMMVTGTVTENGKACRWVEFKWVQNPPPGAQQKGHTTLIKVLIPEENLKTSKDPVKNRVRGWLQERADSGIEALTDDEVGPLPAFLANTLDNGKKLKAKELVTKLGKLECEGVSGSTTFEEGSKTATVTMEIRKHTKAPFGVVWAKMNYQTKRKDGPMRDRGTLTFTLAEVGKNAKSVLPDSK
jgi:hypothetical protein